MTSSRDAHTQLQKWKNESTKLFISWPASTIHGWCIGRLSHAASELHFEVEGVDGRDTLIVVNIHDTYHPRFKFLDTAEGLPFFAPHSEHTHYGTILEIGLQVDQYGQRQGRVVFAEFFRDQAIVV